jgi:hypothetical protein
LIASLKRHGVSDEVIQEALSELKSAMPLGFSLAENIENIK